MSTEEVVGKARELLQIGLPAERGEKLIDAVMELEAVTDIGELTRLLRAI